MGRLTKIAIVYAALSMSMLLVSCDGGGPSSEVDQFIKKIRSESSGRAGKAKEPAAVPPAQAKYSPNIERSPFEIREITNTKKDSSGNPLNGYSLDMLRFVGTVTQDGKSVAFILAPDSRIYQIKVGDTIGDKDGKVISIDEDKISLSEKSPRKGRPDIKRVLTLQVKGTGNE